jgi:hypothetical protein
MRAAKTNVAKVRGKASGDRASLSVRAALLKENVVLLRSDVLPLRRAC